MALTDAISDAIYKPESITTKTAIQGKDASQLGMDDFFNLLVAQMTNQDILNPQDNTEFVAQMAQFTSLQGIQTLAEYQLSSYAASYVGKNVVIADTNSSGELVTIAGMVQTVTFYDGKPMVVVNDKAYDLHKVMEVSATAAKTEEAEEAEKAEDTETVDESTAAATKAALADAQKFIGKMVSLTTYNGVEVVGKVTGAVAQSGKGFVEINNNKLYIVDYITDSWDA